MLWELEMAKLKNHIPVRVGASLTNEERDLMFMTFLKYETDMWRNAARFRKGVCGE